MTEPTRDDVNRVIKRLSGLNRKKAVEVLAAFGARVTPELKPSDYDAVIAAAEKALLDDQPPAEGAV